MTVAASEIGFDIKTNLPYLIHFIQIIYPSHAMPSYSQRLWLLLLLLCPLLVSAEVLIGKVVKITDGDTLVVLDATHTQHKIRLAGIDAPEANQAFGQKSKEQLSGLVAGQEVEVEWQKRDRYQRILGKIIAAGQDVNLVQVRMGMAWWYRKYAGEQSPVDRLLYADVERQTAHAGLWVDPQPLAPWAMALESALRRGSGRPESGLSGKKCHPMAGAAEWFS